MFIPLVVSFPILKLSLSHPTVDVVFSLRMPMSRYARAGHRSAFPFALEKRGSRVKLEIHSS